MDKLDIESEYRTLLKSVIEKVFEEHDVGIKTFEPSNLILSRAINEDELKNLNDGLKSFEIRLVEAREVIDLVGRIKNYIVEIIDSEEIRKEKLSSLLTKKFDYSYSHLSNTFSRKTYISIERFFILVRIEKVKKLLLDNHSLNTIAHRLDFSSVQHLSRQFKNVTGLSTVEFVNLIKLRSK